MPSHQVFCFFSKLKRNFKPRDCRRLWDGLN